MVITTLHACVECGLCPVGGWVSGVGVGGEERVCVCEACALHVCVCLRV